MTKLEFFESIDEFPLERFNAFNKYVMLDTELGSTIQDVDKSIVRINEFLTKDMLDDAKRELQNFRITVSNVLTENDTKGLAYACTVKTVNGKPLTDYSEPKLRDLLKKLSDEGLTIKEVVEHNNDVKKK